MRSYVLTLCTATKHLHEALVSWNFNKMLKSSDEILKSSDDVPRIMTIHRVSAYVDMIRINIRHFSANCEQIN